MKPHGFFSALSYLLQSTTAIPSPNPLSIEPRGSAAYAPSKSPALAGPRAGGAQTVTYNWDLTWVIVNPDGSVNRPVIGINNQWPNPAIYANVGDTVVINANNKLGNESTSLHFHGLYMNGQNHQDGPPQVVQCPIPPGSSYQYKFTLLVSFALWRSDSHSGGQIPTLAVRFPLWRSDSHSGGQIPDGLRGPIIVYDPNDPYSADYKNEFILTITDWYTQQASGPNNLIQLYLDPGKNGVLGPEPIPVSGLMNEQRGSGDTIPDGLKYTVAPSTTYKIRVINMATFSQGTLHVDGHPLTIIEADGIYTEKQQVTDLYVAVAQRYSVLLTTKPDATQNYGILLALDTSKFDDPSACPNPNVIGTLLYNPNEPIPTTVSVSSWDIFDDFNLVPYDQQPALSGTPDLSISLSLDFAEIDQQNRAVFNNITYLAQKVPSLYTAISTGSSAFNNKTYGINANAFIVNASQLVEITIWNVDNGAHPMHLHGHAPQLISRNPPPPGPGIVSKKARRNKLQGAIIAPPINPSPRPLGSTLAARIPMRRETWMIAPNTVDQTTNPGESNASTVIRFQANNPGVWLIHCHMEWHIEAGLTATIVIAPDKIQSTPSLNTVPPAMASICAAQNIPTKGNCAGGTGVPEDPSLCVTKAGPPIPDGAMYPGGS